MGKTRPGFWLEGAGLLLLLLLCGQALAPALSLSPGGNYCGWLTPLANRLALTGERLYTDGTHTPIPPLSLLLLMGLGRGEGRWLTESLLHFGCQAATLLALFAALSRFGPARLAFLAVLAALPAYLAWPRLFLPQILVQFEAVLLAGAAAEWIRRTEAGGPDRARDWFFTLVLGAGGALGLLTEQFTGAGAVLGAALALGLFPRRLSGPLRRQRVKRFLAATGLCCLGLCLLLAPWISFSGLVNDLVVTALEPRGGFWEYALLGWRGLSDLACLAAFAVLPYLCFLGLRSRLAATEAAGPPSGAAAEEAAEPAWAAALPWANAAGAAAALAAVLWLRAFPVPQTRWAFLENLIFCLGVALVWGRIWLERSRRLTGGARAQTVFLLALFLPALFFTLSGRVFTFGARGNLFTAAAAGAFFLFFLAGSSRLLAGSRLFKPASALSCALLLWCLYGAGLGATFQAAAECRSAWPEVAFLRGARLPPLEVEADAEQDGLRTLAEEIERLAPEARREEVLFLPAQPLWEALCRRPSPRLSVLLPYAEFYWDQFVDVDYGRLVSQPPRVIVLGWRGGRYWMDEQRRMALPYAGVERLMERLRRDWLPDRYSIRQMTLLLGGQRLWVDIWVREDQTPQRLSAE